MLQKFKQVFSSASVWHPFPTLKSARLHLVEIQAHHRDDIFAHFSNEAVTRYLDLARMETVADAERLLRFLSSCHQEERGIRWGIQPQEETRLIGTVGFNTWYKRQAKAEIGYDLSPQYWRQGIMREAVQTVLQFGFKQMDLQTIEALVLPENGPSQAFLQHLGFTQGDNTVDFRSSSGSYVTMNIFRLHKADWLTQRVSYQASAISH